MFGSHFIWFYTVGIEVFYVGLLVLVVLAIWVAVLGIRALRLYLRINRPAAPPREN